MPSEEVKASMLRCARVKTATRCRYGGVVVWGSPNDKISLESDF